MPLAMAGLVLFVAGAAIADRRVKKTIRAEHDRASVMIEIRMIDLQQLLFGVNVSNAVFRFELGKRPGVVPIRRRRRIFARRGVNDKKAAVIREIRMQRETNQAAFVKTLV